MMSLRRIPLLVIMLTAMITPVRAKTGRTLITDAQIAKAQEKIKQFDWARSQRDAARAAAQRWLKMSDQELWDFVPPAEQRRALNVSFGVGCPIHGKEVFRKGGHYPWIISADKPFKVTCPVGGETYPSNDFKPWNPGDAAPEKGPGYVDHGTGWVDAKGNRYWFVAYWVFWQRWQRDINAAIHDLTRAYLLTGDPADAHKATVLLCKLASEYESLDYRKQAYHNGQYPAGINGRMVDYIWMNGWCEAAAECYDAIFPALDKDPAAADFLRGKGISDTANQYIRQHLLNPMAKDIMSGFISGNMGMFQHSLAELAIALDNNDPAQGPTTAQMRDWIIHGGGDVDEILWNGFYRDGEGGESSPGYSGGWCVNFYQIADLLPKLGVDIWSNPKLKKMADIGIDMTVAGEFTPDIGDSGSIFGSRHVSWSVALQGAGFRHYHDTRFAKVLHLLHAQTGGLFEDSIDDEVEAVVKKQGTDLDLHTRNLGGYGLGILESGSGDHRRGLSLYYGHAGGGHGHRDRLNIEYWQFGQPMLTDLGYPAHWLAKDTYWTSNTTSHYGVLVNEAGQQTMFPGELNTLAASPTVQLVDASADKVAYPGITSLYRRTTALIDISDRDSYLLDIFRVAGGRQHDWSFHGPPFPDFHVTGVDLQEQKTGTLAGPDVKFGEVPPNRVTAGGLAVPLRECDGVLNDNTPYDARSLKGWATYSDQVLTRKVGAVMTHKLSGIRAGKVKLFLRAYAYSQGTNTVEITLGGATATFTWDAAKQEGWQWLPGQEVTLPAAPDAVTIRAVKQGQNYILIDTLTISSDLKSEGPPQVHDLRQSGFQYLYDVRHGKPAGEWSASWDDPAKDLHLRMTMLPGRVGEVIAARAEPELQPGAPDHLDYVLGRNVAAAGNALESNYAAIVEPYRGKRLVRSVQPLAVTGGDAMTTAAVVDHSTGTDYLFSQLQRDHTLGFKTPDGASGAFRGEFGLATWNHGQLQRALLVNGTELKAGAFDLTADPAPAGSVVNVDYAANTVTVTGSLPDNGALDEQVVFFFNDLHRTSYTIRGVKREGDRSVIALGDVLPIVGVGNVTAVGNGTVTTDTQFTGYGRVDGGRHEGRWLLTEDKKEGWRIEAFNGKVFTLKDAPGDLKARLRDADGDGHPRFWISDIGPGDRFEIPSRVYVERLDDGQMKILSNVPARLGGMGRAGDQAQVQAAGNSWRKVTLGADGAVSVTPEQTAAGRTMVVFHAPAWLVVNDAEPPHVAGVSVDGKPVPPAVSVDLGTVATPPRQIVVKLADNANPLAAPAVMLDAKDALADCAWQANAKAGELRIALPQLTEGAHTVTVAATDRAPSRNRLEFKLAFQYVEPGDVALKSSRTSESGGATVKVDSSYDGYPDASVLIDGNTSFPGDHAGNDISWASAETGDPHWVEIDLPKPVSIHRVSLYWALYGGHYYTSQKYAIQVRRGTEWQTVAQVDGQPEAPVSTHEFAPVTTTAVRLYQNAGGGPVLRPQILWLGEFKVFRTAASG